MHGSSRIVPSSPIWKGILIIFAGVVISGCSEDRQATSPPSLGETESTRFQRQPELSGQDILTKTLERYAEAPFYSDRGVLYLSYRLEGRAIQEPQPWSVLWNSEGKIAAEWFNSQIRSDGQQLSCYIYDIETANLDNQQLILEEGDLIQKLVDDDIARHFVTGQSEIPLRENLAGKQPFLPPTIAMLSQSLVPDWLRNPTNVQRHQDEKIDSRDCFVVACTHDQFTWKLWIDQNLGILWQIEFPIELLDERVQESSDVDEIQLVARFHSASFSRSITPDQFAVQLADNSTLVHKFVKLPEAMPSELIGAETPPLNFIDPDGRNIDTQIWKNKVATFIWLAGSDNKQLLETYRQIVEKYDGDEHHFAAVYSDTQLWQPGSGSYQPTVPIKQFSDQTGIPIYYDQVLDASAALQLKALPSAAIVDSENRLQFAATLKGPDWNKAVEAAIDRISNGEDLASEMIHEYQQYLEKYHQELLANGANPNGVANEALHQVSKSTRRKMKVVQAWSTDQLKSPGNILVTHSDDQRQIFAFDGWRTIVELDDRGNVIAREELELPTGTGAGILRTTLDSNGRRWYAVFMKYGQIAYIMNSNWELVASYPQTNVAFGKITDCQFARTDDAEVKLFVAFSQGGIHRMDLESRRNQTVSQQNVDSLGKRLDLGVANGKLVEFWGSDPASQQALQQWQFRRILQADDQTCGLAVAPDQNFYAVGLDGNLKQQWSISVGSQSFENQIEPLSVCVRSGTPVWAIADAEQGIHFVNHEGKWIGDYQSDAPIQGFDFHVSNRAISLYLATAGRITKWHLSPIDSPLLPASSKRLRTSLKTRIGRPR